jgi:U4/U6.U5 tri-snRNP-associated protein 3
VRIYFFFEGKKNRFVVIGDRTHRDRYQQRAERPTKRYSRSRSRTRSPSPKAFGNKIVEKRLDTTQRIFDRKKIVFMNFLFLLKFILASELQGKTEDEIEMLKTMGFASFDTTKVSS